MHIDRVQFRPGDLKDQLLRRIDPTETETGSADAAAARVAQRDLERYYALLDDALRDAAHGLTLQEARWIVAAHWSTLLDWWAAVLLPTQLHDFADDPEGRSAAAAWRIDPEALHRGASRIGQCSQRAAVIDAIERLRCLPTPALPMTTMATTAAPAGMRRSMT
jgi:hypothetical protein